MQEQLTKYFNTSVFLKQEIEVIRYYSAISEKEKKNEPEKPYKESYIQDINKDVLKKMKEHTGYKFMNIHQVITYLKEMNVTLTKTSSK